ncbi:serine/threonine-protein kinase [Kitasatospora phosalacinea]|uniref:serine/threonine-protein kinase n=1 Tax=Kitasatospora phosalacinea TaxID=2065 RepID=UPI003655512D
MAGARVLAERYRLDELIGRGGMGQVWHGWDVTLHRRVAVKLLPEDQPHDSRDAERFLNEARLAAGLTHPGIVTVHDLDREPDGAVYLVMELLTGTDLAVRLRRDGPPPVAVAVDWMLQLCDALDFAHTAKVIHRDLKPANLFLTPNGRLKVLDFGIAKYAESLTDSHSRVMGTTAYMPPERFHGRSGDQRGDLYSLGCVLFEFLTGRPPFGTGAPAALMLRHLTEPARPAGPETPGPVPPELDRLVLDLLAKEPEDRPASAAEVTARLRPLLTAPATPAAPVAPPSPVRTPTERDVPRPRTPTAPVTVLDTPARRPDPGADQASEADEAHEADEYAARIRAAAAEGRLPLILGELARGGTEYRSDPWLAAAAAAWPADELATLLGAYDAAGHAALADRLAERAAARRDPAELPALFAGMSEAGQRDRLAALSARFAAARPEPPAPGQRNRLSALFGAFRTKQPTATEPEPGPALPPRPEFQPAPQPQPQPAPASAPPPVSERAPGADAGEAEYAEWIRALGAAGRLAEPDEGLRRELRNHRSDAWVDAAARTWPALRVGALLDLYQGIGRNDLASRIVRSVPEHRDPAELPAVLSGLRAAGQHQRIVMLFGAARLRGTSYVEATRAALDAAGEGALAAALGRNREAGRHDPLESVVFPGLYPAEKEKQCPPAPPPSQAPPPTPSPAGKQFLAGGRPGSPGLFGAARGTGEAEYADRIRSSAAAGRLPKAEDVADALGGDGPSVRAWANAAAGAWPAEQLGELLAAYDRIGQGRVADAIVRGLLARRAPSEVPVLVTAMRAARQYARLYALLEGVWKQTPADRDAVLTALGRAGEHAVTAALRRTTDRERALRKAVRTAVQASGGRAPVSAARGPGSGATEAEYVRWIRGRHAAGELPPPERMLARHGYGYQSTAWAGAVARAWPAERLGALLVVYRRTERSRLASEIARRVPEHRTVGEYATVVRALREAGEDALLTMMNAGPGAG